MFDHRLIIVSAKMPEEFMGKVNELLKAGDWRVAETEMSVTDHHYWSMLIQSDLVKSSRSEDK
jgi:hypothetical protein